MVLLLNIFIYMLIFSRRSQEHCVEQLYPVPEMVFHGLSQTSVLSLVTSIARGHR